MLTRSLLALIAAAALHPAFAQAPPPPAITPEAQKADQAATLANVTALRDSYVQAIHAAGLTCPLAPPKIVMDDVPSFGNYDDSNNTLRTADWFQLSPDERAVFFRLAGPTDDEKKARNFFEGAAHRWIFSHEMGHWWQACQKQTSENNPPYAIEYGANRLAAAYWRTADPHFAEQMHKLFAGIYAHSPNPVPQGEDLETYFNAHYEQLGPTPQYRWYQTQMIVTVWAEKPLPNFPQALAKPTK